MFDHRIDLPPPVIGYWVMPGSVGETAVKFTAFTKPRWMHKFFMMFLMGWKWEDV